MGRFDLGKLITQPIERLLDGQRVKEGIAGVKWEPMCIDRRGRVDDKPIFDFNVSRATPYLAVFVLILDINRIVMNCQAFPTGFVFR